VACRIQEKGGKETRQKREAKKRREQHMKAGGVYEQLPMITGPDSRVQGYGDPRGGRYIKRLGQSSLKSGHSRHQMHSHNTDLFKLAWTIQSNPALSDSLEKKKP
jgi:hypothetical protein